MPRAMCGEAGAALARGGGRRLDRGRKDCGDLGQMSMRFAGRTAIVTGGVSGIGAGIVQRLTAEGARVSVWDRDAAALGAAEAPHKVALDVTDAEAVHRAAQAAAEALGKIDILVTSAGI